MGGCRARVDARHSLLSRISWVGDRGVCCQSERISGAGCGVAQSHWRYSGGLSSRWTVIAFPTCASASQVVQYNDNFNHYVCSWGVREAA